MALFPRQVDDQYLMLSRWDRENLSVVSSPGARVWSDPGTIYQPTQWELIQLDLDDPARVIGTLRQQLLTPTEDERNGYLPNILYSLRCVGPPKHSRAALRS